MQRLDVRMILAVTEHARNDLALLGDAKALVGAQRLDIDRPRHSSKLGALGRIVQQRRSLFSPACPAALGAEPDRLGKLAPLFGIVWSNHRVVG